MSQSQLDFQRLRRLNVLRCTKDFEHPLTMWSLAEWGNATAGECGEACNVAKKILRIDGRLKRFTRTSFKSKEDYIEMLGEEIADTILYADLWAAAADIDLAQAIIKKFNTASDEYGSKVKL